MNDLRVKNWDKFQHYTDRNPPWIKVYNTLLNDYQFTKLQDHARWQLIGIWLLASRCDNKLPADADFLQRAILSTEPIDLDALIEAGWLEPHDGVQPEGWPSRYVSAQDRKAVMDRDKKKCVECGSKRRLEIDHIIPVSQNGTSSIDNLQVLCRSCNRKKHNTLQSPEHLSSISLASVLPETETETEAETEFGTKVPGNPVVENSQNGTAQDGETWNEILAPLARRAGGEKHVGNWLAWCKNSLAKGVSVERLEARIGGLCELRDRGVFGEWIEKGVPMTPAIFERTPQLRQECDSAWIKYGPNRSGDIVKRLGVTL